MVGGQPQERVPVPGPHGLHAAAGKQSPYPQLAPACANQRYMRIEVDECLETKLAPEAVRQVAHEVFRGGRSIAGPRHSSQVLHRGTGRGLEIGFLKNRLQSSSDQVGCQGHRVSRSI